MRIASLILAVALLAPVAGAQRTAPCTTATAACEQWITYGNGPSRSMVYASYPLTARNTAVTRALIMVHGAGRNADHYFATAMAAAFLAGALDNTVVLAPHFIAGRDTAQAHEVLWGEGRENWRSGGVAVSDTTLTSFDFLDALVLRLADKRVFPNLTKIVVAGHSAGGQVVTRYEMANRVHDAPGVSLSYVVANPSSYAWPVAVRPLPTGDAAVADAYKAALGRDGEQVHTDYTFGNFDAAAAPGFDNWPSGLNERRTGYTAKTPDAQLRKQLVERPTTYLLGQVDVLPLGGFDSSPNAMAQGPTRRARGEAFFKYVTEVMGAKHRAIIVPECGHNDRCVYTTDLVLPVIFPE